MTSTQGIVGRRGREPFPILLKMLFKVEKEREAGFSPLPPFRPLPLSPLIELNQKSWEM